MNRAKPEGTEFGSNDCQGCLRPLGATVGFHCYLFCTIFQIPCCTLKGKLAAKPQRASVHKPGTAATHGPVPKCVAWG